MKCSKRYFLKIIFSLLISCSIQKNIVFGMIATFDTNNLNTNVNSKDQKVIVFDLDDTLIDVNALEAYPAILWQSLPWNLFTLVGLKSNRKKNQYGVSKFKAKYSEELAPGGGATSLGFYGLNGNDEYSFQELVPKILDITWQNAEFMPGVKTLLDYLQVKKYPIVYATNKDYTSYVHVAKTLDNKSEGAFSKYPKFVLVTQPNQAQLDEWSIKINSEQESIPSNFKGLIQEICKAKENKENHIYFVRGHEKPEVEYYVRLKELIAAEGLDDTKLIFFDDKKINITGAEEAGITGYTIKTAAEIVAGLEKENVLDPEEDQALYAQLEREGVFGFLRKIASYIRNIRITQAATN